MNHVFLSVRLYINFSFGRQAPSSFLDTLVKPAEPQDSLGFGNSLHDSYENTKPKKAAQGSNLLKNFVLPKERTPSTPPRLEANSVCIGKQ